MREYRLRKVPELILNNGYIEQRAFFSIAAIFTKEHIKGKVKITRYNKWVYLAKNKIKINLLVFISNWQLTSL